MNGASTAPHLNLRPLAERRHWPKVSRARARRVRECTSGEYETRPHRHLRCGRAVLVGPVWSRTTDESSFLVVAHAAVLTFDFRVEGLLLKRLVRTRARPPVGNLLYLSLDGVPHDLLPERIALLAHDVLQVLALQIRMRGEGAIHGAGAEHVEVAVLEAAF